MSEKEVRYGVYLNKDLVSEHDWISEAIEEKYKREQETNLYHSINPIFNYRR